MADNGKAGNVFTDRRGMNPFQPMKPQRPSQAKHQFTEREDDYAYNGRGARNPNGSTPLQSFNGRTFPREDPDIAGRRQLMQRRGIREKS